MSRKSVTAPPPLDSDKQYANVVLEYFGFHSMPFSRKILTHQLMALTGQEEMQARLRQAMRDEGIAMVTGLGGCGKSTALRAFRDQLDPNRVQVLYAANPASGLTGIYRDFLTTLGYEPTYFFPQLVSQVRVALRNLISKGMQVVMFIDESHRLKDTWLEDLRMLLSTDMDAGALATLILVGHPELGRRLRMTIHEALWSRINIRYRLKPLRLEETAAYIAHHVKAAGWRGDQLFSDGFITRAFEYTHGIPRRINQLCTYSLLAAKATGTRVIDEAIFQRAQLDLDEDDE